MSQFLKTQWTKYRTRKTKAGIFLDFLFLIFFLAMLHPVSRIRINSFVIRYTMTSPKEVAEKETLSQKDYAWQYMDFNGQANEFSALKGKVIFLNFWATWCPPCVAEFPSIQELYNTYGDQVEFVLISSEDKTVIQNFLAKKGYTTPVFSPIDYIPDLLNTSSLPTTFVIAKNGEIILKKKGAAKWNSEKVKNLLDELIAE